MGTRTRKILQMVMNESDQKIFTQLNLPAYESTKGSNFKQFDLDHLRCKLFSGKSYT